MMIIFDASESLLAGGGGAQHAVDKFEACFAADAMAGLAGCAAACAPTLVGAVQARPRLESTLPRFQRLIVKRITVLST